MSARLSFDKALRSSLKGATITDVYIDSSNRQTIHEVRLEINGSSVVSFLPLEGRVVLEYEYKRGSQ